MAGWRFDDRVAIVTGAGSKPGLGRAFAMLLAQRGARVMVNDIGVHGDGWSAQKVVEEICAQGGEAVADDQSVAAPASAAAIVDRTIEHFGQVDILVNNAGICIPAAIDEISPDDFRNHVDVNLLGAVWMCQAAWPHFRAQGQGRIVNITSSAMTGFAGQTAYAASKGGLWSLTRSLAAEGAELGISVNAVSPGGYSQLMEAILEADSPLLATAHDRMPAELAAPAVAWLAHTGCPLNGECLDAAGGEIGRTLMARPPVFSDKDPTIETIAARWHELDRPDEIEPVPVAGMNTGNWRMKPYRREKQSHA